MTNSGAPSESGNELVDSLLGDFLDESDQLLTQLNANLLQLDEWVQTRGADHQQRCDEGLLNEMFRAAHSLKGLSAMLGFGDINHLTHKIENVFDAARHGQLRITSEVTELMFMGLDQLVALVGLLKEPGGPAVDCDAILNEIGRFLQASGAERRQATQADAERALAAALQEDSGAVSSPAEIAPAARPADPFAGIQDDDDIPDSYLSMFIDEADASLDALAGGLLTLEGTAVGDELKQLLGTAHKIKGSAASIGLNRAAKLAHLMEDLLEERVATASSLTPQMTDVLLRCTDGLRQHVADLRGGHRGADHFCSPAQALFAAQRREPHFSDAGRLEQQAARHNQTTSGRNTYLGEVTFPPDLPMSGLKALLVYEKLIRLGHLDDCQPAPAELDNLDHVDCFRFRLVTDRAAEAVVNQLRIGGVAGVTLQEQPASAEPATVEAESQSPLPASPAPPPRGESAPRAAATGQRPAETVRVDTERLDQLMDLTGQLVINRAQLSQIGGRFKDVADCNQAVRALDRLSGELHDLGSVSSLRLDVPHLLAELESLRGQLRRIGNELEPIRREVQVLSRTRDSVRELFEALHQLDRVSSGIQKSVMDIRMVPIGPLFARFNRVVRDISRAGGKEIRLAIAGEKTELDKRMIDELGDPLVHLVRNSADHGIELPDEREAAGKPRQGTVTLEAFHRGNCIVIEARDDGRGLDTDRILRKALDKGLVTEADAQRMTPHQVQQLIWKPGLSTAEQVTDVSGRGMGMDIVKARVEDLSGTVEIASTPGRGTTITIKLPLTLAILPSLMVDIEGDTFAIPMEVVREIVSVGHSGVHVVGGRLLAAVRDRAVPLVRLGDVLTLRRRGGTPVACPPPETILVVVHDAGQEIGLAVDCVIGEQDVVIKSIAQNYRNVAGVAGASILGNGRVALILDIPALLARLAPKEAQAAL